MAFLCFLFSPPLTTTLFVLHAFHACSRTSPGSPMLCNPSFCSSSSYTFVLLFVPVRPFSHSHRSPEDLLHSEPSSTYASSLLHPYGSLSASHTMGLNFSLSHYRSHSRSPLDLVLWGVSDRDNPAFAELE